MTTDVTTSALVAPGQTLAFHDETSFELLQPGYQQPGPTLEIAGTVSVNYDAAPNGAFAIRADQGSGFNGGAITIDAGAALRVVTTATEFPAEGILAAEVAPKVVNNGLIDMTGTGGINAIESTGDIVIENHGVIHVSTTALAHGVDALNGPTFTNTGSINVSGGPLADAVTLSGLDSSFLNAGTITATATGGPSIGVEVYTSLTKDGSVWTNTGTIQADTALQAYTGPNPFHHMDFVNQGRLIGQVLLGNATEAFTNSGTIQGGVDLGGGDDSYSGASGLVSGPLHGGDGDDLIQGGGEGESLFGDAGNDTVTGGPGDDTLNGGTGSDHLDGAGGVNTVSYADVRASGVTLDLGAGTESDNGTSDTLAHVQRVVGSNFADSLTGSGADETISAGIGADTVHGGGGNDSIDGGSGLNYLRGDDGNDTIQGGSAFDDINGNQGDDVAHGGDGDDWVVGGKDNDQLWGDAGGDIVWGNLGNDTLDGGDGNDQVRGGQGDDIVQGGAGDDYVSGDRGSDTVTGGAGADIFHSFSGAGLDVVTDFNAGEGDRVMLDPGTNYTLSQVGADTIVDMGNGDQLVLQHTTLASLPTGWIFEG